MRRVERAGYNQGLGEGAHLPRPSDSLRAGMSYRRLLRFSLSGLFIAVSVICVALAWGVNEGRRRHRTIVNLQRAGVGLFFEHQGALSGTYYPDAKPPGLPFMKQLLGEYYNTRVIQIEAVPLGRLTDSDAKEITVFQELDWLAANGSELTDEGLKHLAALRNLGRLDVERCRITPGGIAELRRALPKADVYSDFGKN